MRFRASRGQSAPPVSSESQDRDPGQDLYKVKDGARVTGRLVAGVDSGGRDDLVTACIVVGDLDLR